MFVDARNMGHFISDVATALVISQARVYQLYVYSGQTSTSLENCEHPQVQQKRNGQ